MQSLGDNERRLDTEIEQVDTSACTSSDFIGVLETGIPVSQAGVCQ